MRYNYICFAYHNEKYIKKTSIFHWGQIDATVDKYIFKEHSLPSGNAYFHFYTYSFVIPRSPTRHLRDLLNHEQHILCHIKQELLSFAHTCVHVGFFWGGFLFACFFFQCGLCSSFFYECFVFVMLVCVLALFLMLPVSLNFLFHFGLLSCCLFDWFYITTCFFNFPIMFFVSEIFLIDFSVLISSTLLPNCVSRFWLANIDKTNLRCSLASAF